MTMAARGVACAMELDEFAESLELDYAILSDPDKKFAQSFGVLEPEGRYALRHTIYIGSELLEGLKCECVGLQPDSGCLLDS